MKYLNNAIFYQLKSQKYINITHLSIYLYLRRLLGDLGLLIARMHHAPAHARVTSFSTTTSSIVNISPNFSRALQQTLNHHSYWMRSLDPSVAIS